MGRDGGPASAVSAEARRWPPGSCALGDAGPAGLCGALGGGWGGSSRVLCVPRLSAAWARRFGARHLPAAGEGWEKLGGREQGGSRGLCTLSCEYPETGRRLALRDGDGVKRSTVAGDPTGKVGEDCLREGEAEKQIGGCEVLVL